MPRRLAVGLTAGVLVALSAGPAAAAPNEASCVGRLSSAAAQTSHPVGRTTVAPGAIASGGLGSVVSGLAQSCVP
jgi:hypothetical protein